MSTSKTKEYKLHKWEGEDNVSRAEFNENFEKVDKKLRNIDDRSMDTFNKSENLKKELQNQNNKYNELRKKIESTVGDVNTSVTVEISNLKNKITSNINKLNSIENKLNTNNVNCQGGINLNKSQISSLSKNISNNKSDISNNKRRIDTLDSNNKNFNGKFIGYDSSINKINKDLSNNSRSLNNLNVKVAAHDNSINSINSRINNISSDDDYTSFSYSKVSVGQRINFKKGSGIVEFSRHMLRDEHKYKNIGWIVIENEDRAISLRVDSFYGHFRFVTGSFVKNNKTYSGSWHENGCNIPVAGLDDYGVIRGAIYEGELKGLFGNGNHAKDLIVQSVFFTKNNKGDSVVRINYENKGSAFTSNKVYINGFTFKS
ncbi:hypothetical protein WG909_07440 [Peptostreptococcaceae bacterium AGR-M142]